MARPLKFPESGPMKKSTVFIPRDIYIAMLRICVRRNIKQVDFVREAVREKLARESSASAPGD